MSKCSDKLHILLRLRVLEHREIKKLIQQVFIECVRCARLCPKLWV